jgi:hypothetical protein
MRPDGKIVQTAGYDADTGILYAPGHTYPAVPDYPTLDDARRAAETILDLVVDFPFTAVHHRAAWLALFLTLTARIAVAGEVPLFAIGANQPGTGKDLLADLAHLAAFGRVLPVMGWPEREEERDKRMLVVAMNGDPAVLLSNINTPLGGETLEMALTAASYKGRILGFSENVDAPLNTVFIATGNNLTFTNDGMNRRVIPIALYFPDADPELRSGFKHANIRDHTREHHPHLAAAGLTILRAFHVAGRPVQPDTRAVGGFAAWCGLIRNAVLWAGFADPTAGRQEVKKARDGGTESFLAVLRLLYAGSFYLPNTAYTSIQHLRKHVEQGLKQLSPDPVAEEMRDALIGMARGIKNELPNAASIGNAFRKLKGRVFEGHRLEQMPDDIKAPNGAACWTVERCENT